MKVVVAGGSGFLGQPLVARLIARHDDVAVLTRDPAKVRAGHGVRWDGKTQGDWSAEVAAADAVINLAGENIGEGRWTDERKRRLVASRIDPTNAIVEALKRGPRRERVLVNASAVGYYGDRGEEELDERSGRGTGFNADLVAEWESAARAGEPYARVVIPRFGVALDMSGGALPKMAMPFRFGVGGPIGRGMRWMSWVDREDLLRAIEWLIDHDSARGIFNVTAPQPIRNREFARTLGEVLRRPSLFPVPPIVLRFLFGQMADETLLVSQCVLPRRIEDQSFPFLYRDAYACLRHVTAR